MIPRLQAIFLLSILVFVPARGEQVWHFPTPISSNAFVTRHHIEFAERVERETEGALTIAVHPGGSLFKAADIFRAVRTGQVPIGSTGLFLHPSEHPLFALANLPFLVEDLEEAKKLITISRPALEQVLRRKNLKLIYRALWNPQGLFSARRLESPEDFKGMKIRTYNNTTTRIVQLANGIPTKTEPSEIAPCIFDIRHRRLVCLGSNRRVPEIVGLYRLLLHNELCISDFFRGRKPGCLEQP